MLYKLINKKEDLKMFSVTPVTFIENFILLKHIFLNEKVFGIYDLKKMVTIPNRNEEKISYIHLKNEKILNNVLEESSRVKIDNIISKIKISFNILKGYFENKKPYIIVLNTKAILVERNGEKVWIRESEKNELDKVIFD